MNFVKKISMFFAFIFAFSSLILPISVSAASAVTKYDVSSVMDDLSVMRMDDGTAFNEADYPVRQGEDLQPELITVNEVGFTNGTEVDNNYSLYFYVYNPNTLLSEYITKNADYYHDQFGQVRIEYSYDDESTHLEGMYKPLILVDHSDDGRFFKFKITGLDSWNKILKGKEARIYRIVDLSIPIGTKNTSYGNKHFGINQKYVFSGESINKVVTLYDSPHLQLDVHCVNWRSNTSASGKNYQNDLFTAYFAIPNEIVEEYQDLYGIKAQWNELKTGPVIVTDDADIYTDAQNNLIGKTLTTDSKGKPEKNSDLSGIMWGVTAYTNGTSPVQYNGDYGFNAPLFKSLTFFYTEKEVLEAPKYIHLTGDIDDYYFNLSEETYDELKVYESGIKEYIVTRDKDQKEIKSLWQGDRWKQFFFGGHIFDEVNEIDTTVDPFYYLKASDFAGFEEASSKDSYCNALFIGERYIDSLYRFYKEASAQDKTVVLFRYSLQQYYASDAAYFFGNKSEASFFDQVNLSNVEVVQTYYYKDFEIIDLRYQKEDTVYIIPTDSNSVDFYPGFDDNYGSEDSTNKWVEKHLPNKDDFEFLLRILSAILVLIVVIIFWKPISKFLFKHIKSRRKKNE